MDVAIAAKLRVVASRTSDDDRHLVAAAWADVAATLAGDDCPTLHRALLIRVAEAASAAGQHGIAAAALAEFLRRPEGSADRYRVRAWLVEAALLARSAAQQSGSAALARTAEAVACCLRGLALAEALAATTAGGGASELAGAGNALVYNSSVVHWRVVRPFLRPGVRKLAAPSLRRMLDALAASRDPNLPWRMAHAVALSTCLAEMCEWDAAASTAQGGLELLASMTPDQAAVSGSMREQLQRLSAHAKAFADGGAAIAVAAVLVPPPPPASASGAGGGGAAKSSGKSATGSAAAAAVAAAAPPAAAPNPADVIARAWAVLQPLLSVTSPGLGITTPYVVSVASRTAVPTSGGVAGEDASGAPAAPAVLASAGDALVPLPAVTVPTAISRTKELKALALSTPPALPSGYSPSSTLEARLVELVEALHPPTAALYQHRKGELSAGVLNFVLPVVLQAPAVLASPPAAAPASGTVAAPTTPSHATGSGAKVPVGTSPRPATGGSHGSSGSTGASASAGVAEAGELAAAAAAVPAQPPSPTYLGDSHGDLLAWVAQAAVQNGLTHLAYLILQTLKARKTASADVVILCDVVSAQLLVAALTVEDARAEAGMYERAPADVVETLTLLATASATGGDRGAPVGMRRMSMAMGLQSSLVPRRSSAGDVLMLPAALNFAATDLPAMTPAQVARVAQSRRTEAVKLLKTAAATAVQTKQWHLVEFICTLGWNLALPLLAASDVLPFQIAGHGALNGRPGAATSSARHRAPVQSGSMALQGALDAFATALHDAGSTNVTLLSRLHTVLSHMHAARDMLATARDHIARALALDYGSVRWEETAGVPLPLPPTFGLSDAAVLDASSVARPLDRFLLPLQQLVTLRASVYDDPVDPVEKATVLIEQARHAKSPSVAGSLLEKAATLLDDSTPKPRGSEAAFRAGTLQPWQKLQGGHYCSITADLSVAAWLGRGDDLPPLRRRVDQLWLQVATLAASCSQWHLVQWARWHVAAVSWHPLDSRDMVLVQVQMELVWADAAGAQLALLGEAAQAAALDAGGLGGTVGGGDDTTGLGGDEEGVSLVDEARAGQRARLRAARLLLAAGRGVDALMQGDAGGAGAGFDGDGVSSSSSSPAGGRGGGSSTAVAPGGKPSTPGSMHGGEEERKRGDGEEEGRRVALDAAASFEWWVAAPVPREVSGDAAASTAAALPTMEIGGGSPVAVALHVRSASGVPPGEKDATGAGVDAAQAGTVVPATTLPMLRWKAVLITALHRAARLAFAAGVSGWVAAAVARLWTAHAAIWQANVYGPSVMPLLMAALCDGFLCAVGCGVRDGALLSKAAHVLMRYLEEEGRAAAVHSQLKLRPGGSAWFGVDGAVLCGVPPTAPPPPPPAAMHPGWVAVDDGEWDAGLHAAVAAPLRTAASTMFDAAQAIAAALFAVPLHVCYPAHRQPVVACLIRVRMYAALGHCSPALLVGGSLSGGASSGAGHTSPRPATGAKGGAAPAAPAATSALATPLVALDDGAATDAGLTATHKAIGALQLAAVQVLPFKETVALLQTAIESLPAVRRELMAVVDRICAAALAVDAGTRTGAAPVAVASLTASPAGKRGGAGGGRATSAGKGKEAAAAAAAAMAAAGGGEGGAGGPATGSMPATLLARSVDVGAMEVPALGAMLAWNWRHGDSSKHGLPPLAPTADASPAAEPQQSALMAQLPPTSAAAAALREELHRQHAVLLVELWTAAGHAALVCGVHPVACPTPVDAALLMEAQRCCVAGIACLPDESRALLRDDVAALFGAPGHTFADYGLDIPFTLPGGVGAVTRLVPAHTVEGGAVVSHAGVGGRHSLYHLLASLELVWACAVSSLVSPASQSRLEQDETRRQALDHVARAGAHAARIGDSAMARTAALHGLRIGAPLAQSPTSQIALVLPYKALVAALDACHDASDDGHRVRVELYRFVLTALIQERQWGEGLAVADAAFETLPAAFHGPLWASKLEFQSRQGQDVTLAMSKMREGNALLRGKLWLTMTRLTSSREGQAAAYAAALDSLRDTFASVFVLMDYGEWLLVADAPIQEARDCLHSAAELLMRVIHSDASWAEGAAEEAAGGGRAAEGDAASGVHSTAGGSMARRLGSSGSVGGGGGGGAASVSRAPTKPGSVVSRGGRGSVAGGGSVARAGSVRLGGAGGSVAGRAAAAAAADAKADDWPTRCEAVQFDMLVRVWTVLATTSATGSERTRFLRLAAVYAHQALQLTCHTVNTAAAERAYFAMPDAARSLIAYYDQWLTERVRAGPFTPPETVVGWCALLSAVLASACADDFVATSAVTSGAAAPAPAADGAGAPMASAAVFRELRAAIAAAPKAHQARVLGSSAHPRAALTFAALDAAATAMMEAGMHCEAAPLLLWMIVLTCDVAGPAARPHAGVLQLRLLQWADGVGDGAALASLQPLLAGAWTLREADTAPFEEAVEMQLRRVQLRRASVTAKPVGDGASVEGVEGPGDSWTSAAARLITAGFDARRAWLVLTAAAIEWGDAGAASRLMAAAARHADAYQDRAAKAELQVLHLRLDAAAGRIRGVVDRGLDLSTSLASASPLTWWQVVEGTARALVIAGKPYDARLVLEQSVAALQEAVERQECVDLNTVAAVLAARVTSARVAAGLCRRARLDGMAWVSDWKALEAGLEEARDAVETHALANTTVWGTVVPAVHAACVRDVLCIHPSMLPAGGEDAPPLEDAACRSALEQELPSTPPPLLLLLHAARDAAALANRAVTACRAWCDAALRTSAAQAAWLAAATLLACTAASALAAEAAAVGQASEELTTASLSHDPVAKYLHQTGLVLAAGRTSGSAHASVTAAHTLAAHAAAASAIAAAVSTSGPAGFPCARTYAAATAAAGLSDWLLEWWQEVDAARHADPLSPYQTALARRKAQQWGAPVPTPPLPEPVGPPSGATAEAGEDGGGAGGPASGRAGKPRAATATTAAAAAAASAGGAGKDKGAAAGGKGAAVAGGGKGDKGGKEKAAGGDAAAGASAVPHPSVAAGLAAQPLATDEYSPADVLAVVTAGGAAVVPPPCERLWRGLDGCLQAGQLDASAALAAAVALRTGTTAPAATALAIAIAQASAAAAEMRDALLVAAEPGHDVATGLRLLSSVAGPDVCALDAVVTLAPFAASAHPVVQAATAQLRDACLAARMLDVTRPWHTVLAGMGMDAAAVIVHRSDLHRALFVAVLRRKPVPATAQPESVQLGHTLDCHVSLLPLSEEAMQALAAIRNRMTSCMEQAAAAVRTFASDNGIQGDVVMPAASAASPATGSLARSPSTASVAGGGGGGKRRMSAATATSDATESSLRRVREDLSSLLSPAWPLEASSALAGAAVTLCVDKGLALLPWEALPQLQGAKRVTRDLSLQVAAHRSAVWHAASGLSLQPLPAPDGAAPAAPVPLFGSASWWRYGPPSVQPTVSRRNAAFITDVRTDDLLGGGASTAPSASPTTVPLSRVLGSLLPPPKGVAITPASGVGVPPATAATGKGKQSPSAAGAAPSGGRTAPSSAGSHRTSPRTMSAGSNGDGGALAGGAGGGKEGDTAAAPPTAPAFTLAPPNGSLLALLGGEEGVAAVPGHMGDATGRSVGDGWWGVAGDGHAAVAPAAMAKVLRSVQWRPAGVEGGLDAAGGPQSRAVGGILWFSSHHRLLSYLPPSVLTSCPLAPVRLAVLLDNTSSDVSARWFAKHVNEATAAHPSRLALEGAWETAALLAMAGVGAVVTNQWPATTAANEAIARKVGGALVASGGTGGGLLQAVWAALHPAPSSPSLPPPAAPSGGTGASAGALGPAMAPAPAPSDLTTTPSAAGAAAAAVVTPKVRVQGNVVVYGGGIGGDVLVAP